MARIPEPRPGLIFRYRFLRRWQYDRGEQVGKERPCCLLLPLKAGQVLGGNPLQREGESTPVDRYITEGDEVLILLIQSDPPGVDQMGIALSIEDKKYVGLPADAASYVIVSEVNVDRWPNGDMSLVPGRPNSFIYDRPLAGPVLSRVVAAFLKVQKARKMKVLVRHS